VWKLLTLSLVSVVTVQADDVSGDDELYDYGADTDDDDDASDADADDDDAVDDSDVNAQGDVA